MKRLTTISIIIICLVCSIYGQETNTTICTNKAIEKVNSRGVKIGLKVDEVLNLFDLTEEEKQRILNSNSNSKEKFGYKIFGIQPKPSEKKFDGIGNYSFGFLDNLLVNFNVNYSKPNWKNINQFGNTMIKFFDLPKIEKWQNNSFSLTIQCENYFINLQASNNSNGSFSIFDTRIRQILPEREKKFIEEQREKEIKAFKP